MYLKVAALSTNLPIVIQTEGGGIEHLCSMNGSVPAELATKRIFSSLSAVLSGNSALGLQSKLHIRDSGSKVLLQKQSSFLADAWLLSLLINCTVFTQMRLLAVYSWSRMTW